MIILFSSCSWIFSNYSINDVSYNSKFYNILLESIGSEAAEDFKTQKVAPLLLKATNSKNEVIGGLAAYFFYGSLLIDILWIKKEYRKRGIGSSLMKKAESIAIDKKLKMISVSTMGFWNNLDFYKKQGFQVEFIKKGFEKNLLQYHLVKQITDKKTDRKSKHENYKYKP